MTSSVTHLVLIPSYDTGAQVLQTVRDARRAWEPVWVVVDGSTDGTAELLVHRAGEDPGLRVFVLPVNGGKGGAILHGLHEAEAAGFTHVLTMDADGQHPAVCLPAFMAASRAQPEAMVLGLPVFDAGAPGLRVKGRRISNWWANLETGWTGIGDSLFGFRVYPVADLLRIMGRTRWMRRFDFDAEAAVRLTWRGLPLVNLPAPVRYLSLGEGGVSHFRYGRDNALLTWMHTRLMLGAIARLPWIIARAWRRRDQAGRARPAAARRP